MHVHAHVHAHVHVHVHAHVHAQARGFPPFLFGWCKEGKLRTEAWYLAMSGQIPPLSSGYTLISLTAAVSRAMTALKRPWARHLNTCPLLKQEEIAFGEKVLLAMSKLRSMTEPPPRTL